MPDTADCICCIIRHFRRNHGVRQVALDRWFPDVPGDFAVSYKLLVISCILIIRCLFISFFTFISLIDILFAPPDVPGDEDVADLLLAGQGRPAELPQLRRLLVLIYIYIYIYMYLFIYIEVWGL